MIYVRRVAGKSMLPKLEQGDLVLMIKGVRYKPGQIVMLEHDGKEKIKLISEAHGGDVFVTGLNQGKSTDSRHFGWVPAKKIKARLVYKFKKQS